MNKRVLMVATVPSMIGQFNMNNIRILMDLGYEVDVAADFTDRSVWTDEKVASFQTELESLGIEYYQLDFSRNALDLGRHIKSYKEVLNLLKDRNYSFIHTHTPIASAIVRLATKKMKTKVIYTAHGFHFYDGAPFKNWLIFYPVEKWLSRWTDILITITKEDYNRALKCFKAKRVEYIPGVGVDTKKFAPDLDGRKRIRKELGVDDSRIVLLSVGELNDNKNHISVVDAIKGMDLTYVIVGQGKNHDMLLKRAQELKVDLRLMGYRRDVSDFYNAADVYVLPSIREGLNVSLMEAMASGLSVVCGRIRGNVDLIEDNNFLFSPRNTVEINNAIRKAIDDKKKSGYANQKKVETFSMNIVRNLTQKAYTEI